MILHAEQLTRHAREPLKPIYLVHGDEALLQQESTDLLRQMARQQGFTEREVHHVEKGMNWDEILASVNNLSLFGDRKIMELRFRNKPDKQASDILEKYASDPAPDTLLLIQLPKLDGTNQKAKWFVACEKAGVSIGLPDINSDSFPDWLQNRLSKAGLSSDIDTFNLLLERLEGNLLAAQQEIEKLKLVAENGFVSLASAQQSVGDCARYNVYDLADAALQGDISRTARILSGLRAEGESDSTILWAIAKDARALAALREGIDAKQPINALMQQNGIWAKRQSLFQRALQRTSTMHAQTIVRECLTADMAIKGQNQETSADVLLRLCMLITGRPLFVTEPS